MLDIPHAGQVSDMRRGVRFPHALRDGAGWQGFVLVALGWSGVGLAYGLVGIANDPASGGPVLGVAVVSLVSLAAIARGVVIAYSAARSALRHVFRSRSLFGTGATLLTIAALGLVALVTLAPFAGLAAHDKPLAELTNDLTLAGASLTCFIGGGVALVEAWKARRAERIWG